MNLRGVDAKVAEAMNLEVVGEAWCWNPDGGGWSILSAQAYPDTDRGLMRPVFVAHCFCDLYDDDPEEDRPERLLGHYWTCLEPVSFYSIDWAAAGQIVQAMRCGHAGHAAAVIEMIVYDHLPPNDCYCHIYGPDLAGGEAYANEMPLAICLAFLKAMGVEAGE